MGSSSKPGQTFPSRSARTCPRTTRAVSASVTSRARPMTEAVVMPGRRARLAVQRVTPVPAEVLLLGSRADEQVQSGRADDRADRVHARAAVAPDGGQEAQPDAELVELPAARVRQGGLVPLELGPGDHFADATPVSLTSCVSDPD
ncbi:MAG TPA: hypothetical protein VK280_10270 [Streptosporangiaceae bacterium]|nr:hypothetical protein [Streptosporangiaceae bacterium]